MKSNLIEDVPLTPKYVMFNPDDLKIFDKQVGVGNRSKKIRELIREYNEKRDVSK